MKKHIYTIMTIIGVLLFLFTLFEIVDMSWVEIWGEGFYGSWYYWFILVGFVLFFIGYGRMIKKEIMEEIEKKIDSKTDEKPM